MNLKYYTLIVSLPLLFSSCSTEKKTFEGEVPTEEMPEVIDLYNPPAEGFNMEASESTAILIADKVMASMGGRAAWDNLSVVSWNFFEYRKLLWDKENNRVRINYLKEDLSIALDMNDMSGTVWKDGQKLVQEDSIKKYLEGAKSAWINDSYWLVMPFKLKDSGVTLIYMGEDTTQTGIRSDVLRLTFDNVGDTPQNAYHVWVDIDEKLVRQWAWYVDALDTVPRFTLPWDEYKQFGDLLLSAERGDRDLSELKVMDQIPEGAFTDQEFKI